MEKYDYLGAVYRDVFDWVLENHDDYPSADAARDDAEFTATGNDNGSYTCNRALAEEYTRSFMYSLDWDLFTHWVDDMGADLADIMSEAETLDVYIRLFYFGRVWDDVTGDTDWSELAA